ncbi:MAG: PilN domain-containing protein [Syntrophales bacterium]|nr:PilN domain-containing protein [Syntrophales bacterium]
MIKINLLPYHEIAKKETYVKQLTLVVAGTILFLLCLTFLYLWAQRSVAYLAEEVKGKEARLLALNKMVGEVDRIKQEKQILERKLAVIGELERGRIYTVKLLADIANHVPVGSVWLEKLIQGSGGIQLEGKARDNFAIVQLMKNLETSPFIQSVELVSSKQVEEAQVKLQQFHVSCLLRPGF